MTLSRKIGTLGQRLWPKLAAVAGARFAGNLLNQP